MREADDNAGMGRLNGKVAFVSGAGAGIGASVTRLFAAEGARVIAADLDAAALDGFTSIRDVDPVQIDVSDRGRIEDLAERFPKVDIMVNCASFVHHGTILDCDDEGWRKSFAVNVDGIYYAIQAWLPGMVTRGEGAIVNIASVLSSLHAMPARSAYAATKAAVIGLTKSIAMDFMPNGIRANAICPGPINSPSFAQRLQQTGDEGAARARMQEMLPKGGRIGEPDEAASLALFLASAESSYITGQALIFDGGWKL
jgi:2-keto-3-deoxy-L-fuconate dehydrogenase